MRLEIYTDTARVVLDLEDAHPRARLEASTLTLGEGALWWAMEATKPGKERNLRSLQPLARRPRVDGKRPPFRQVKPSGAAPWYLKWERVRAREQAARARRASPPSAGPR